MKAQVVDDSEQVMNENLIDNVRFPLFVLSIGQMSLFFGRVDKKRAMFIVTKSA